MCCSVVLCTSLNTYVVCLRSGPPCPPVSSIGQRGGDNDCRAEVFYCVVRWVIWRANHGERFAFFVLENPDGIIKRKKNESESLADRIQTLLKAELPRAWHMYVQRLNSTESGLPAQRPRVFIIGVSPQMRNFSAEASAGQACADRAACAHL